MERLTYDFCIGGNHCWQVKGADNNLCKDVCKEQGDNGCESCPIRNAFDRLAAYEDAMPLERARELAQAEQDGRLVVLSCKVGDTVYVIRSRKIVIATVEAIHQWSSGVWRLNVYTDKRSTHWVGYELFLDDFGKTAFLTREEAEAALKKREAEEK